MTTLIMTADKFGFETFSKWLKELNEKRIQEKLARATVKELSKLSDKELRDIGIARGDIHSIAYGCSDYTRIRGRAL